MGITADTEALSREIKGAMVNDLDQQVEDSLQRLEQLWQCTEKLPISHLGPLVDALKELSNQLQKMQGVIEELRQQIQQEFANKNHAELEEQQRSPAEGALISDSTPQEMQIIEPAHSNSEAVSQGRGIGFLVTNREAVILSANWTSGELLESIPETLIGKPLVEFVATDAHRDFHTQLSALQQGSVANNWEICLQTRQGKTFNAIVTVEPVQEPQFLQVVGLRWLLQQIPPSQDDRLVDCSAANWECAERNLKNQVEGKITQNDSGVKDTRLQKTLHEQPYDQLNRDRTTHLQQILDFEAMLKRITDKVRDTLDENHILQTAVEELTLVLGIEGCDTALYDANQTTATIVHEYTQGLPSALGQVVTISDLFKEDAQLLKGQYFQFCHLIPEIRGAVAILACPIFDSQAVFGDLWLFKRQEEAFNELEIQLVQQVASQCAIAIRQARLYQAAQAQVAELEKLNRLKDDFLSTVPHELRSPVANMKMAIQMLGIALNKDHGLFAELSKPPAQRNKVARYFHILHNECERETNLINDLLEWQRINAEIQPLVLTSIQLQDWLPTIVEPFQKPAQERDRHLEIHLESELPPLICDRTSLGRILSELLNNACKYTPLAERIAVKARSAADKMEVSVMNTGVEIPTGERERVFEKFYRIPNSDPWKQGGTGLGLALVQKLVANLGGAIHLESAANYTCFTVSLPLKPSIVSDAESP
ncbi:ATP-binding protein [Coleofasciculus sp. FACHB-1120]|uniref:ATP-binding protein n=1 Tax=Coleofasciculus sp. FACHB-1120 TaxID=2692783 RepID=UPI001A7E2234|nr:ATP-binding protein [Coleofasciculus sp. FACHB-1120]